MQATELHLSFGRKHPLDRYDMVAMEATITIQAESGESDDATIMAGFRHMAALLRQAVDEQLTEIVATHGRPTGEPPHPAQIAAGYPPAGYAPAEPPPEDTPKPTSQAPASAEEARQRFYARYGEAIGGTTWAHVRRYAGLAGVGEPRNIKGWYAAAEAVRARMQRETTTTNGKH